MPTIIYIQHNGNQFEAHLESGSSVMQGAIDNGIDGIIAECGGSCTCATCHCYVEPAWLQRLDPPSELEQQMLECVLEPQDNSRLSCQIKVTDDLDGLVIHLPESQF